MMSTHTRSRIVLGGVVSILCSVVANAESRHPEIEYWQTRGSGFVLEVSGSDYRLFDTTRLSLLPVEHGAITDGTLIYQGLPAISLDMFEAMSSRIPQLPKAEVTGYIDDPQKLFDIFWTNIDQYYSFFNFLPKNEWRRLYDQYRPLVHPDTTPDELWTLVTQMFKVLNDGHTFLVDLSGRHPGLHFSRPPSPSRWMVDSLNEYVTVIRSYLDPSSVEVRGNIIAGTIGQQVAYVNILSFDGFAPEPPLSTLPGDVPLSLLTELSGEVVNTEPFVTVLNQLMAKFEGTQALILDLRFNGGGAPALVTELSDRLTARERLAYSYRFRNGGHEQFDKPVHVSLTPKTPGYLNRPVIVLTSNNSMSAADLQAMILRDFPNVKLVGEPTYGIFAEEMPRQIPVRSANTELEGWVLFTSTLRLFNSHGESFERRGVPPDIEVHPDRDQLAAGNDNMLESALRFVGPVNVTRNPVSK